MPEDRLPSVRQRYDRFHEISRAKHGIASIPITWVAELESDLRWCIAEVEALRSEVERLRLESR
jgi:hypothetical protein